MKTKKKNFFLPFYFILFFMILLYQDTVSAANTESDILEETKEIAVNATYDLKYHLSYKKEDAVYSFATDRSDILSIASNQKVTSLKPGSATLTIKETYQGKTKTYKLVKYTVKSACISILSPTDIAVNGTSKTEIVYKNPKASYKVTSSNPSIVTMKSKLSFTGKKAGTAYLILTETYQKKTKEISRVKIIVTASKLNKANITLARNEQIHLKYNIISYKNEKAVYKASANDKTILNVQSNQSVTAKNWGTAYLTVTETYQNRTRTVGKLKITVAKSTIDERFLPRIAYIDEPIGVPNDIKNADSLAAYSYESKDPTICKIENDKLIPLKEGVTALTVTETTQKKSRVVGEIPVIIKTQPESIEFTFLKSWENTDNREYYITVTEGSTGCLKTLLEVRPSQLQLQYTSSNESVLSIDPQTGIFQTHTSGEAMVTISGKTSSRELKIIVASKDKLPELSKTSITYISAIDALNPESITQDTLNESFQQLIDTYKILGKESLDPDGTVDKDLYSISNTENFWMIPNVYIIDQYRSKLSKETYQCVHNRNAQRRITNVKYINSNTLELELNLPFIIEESLYSELHDIEGSLYQNIREFEIRQIDGTFDRSGTTNYVMGSSTVTIDTGAPLPDGTYEVIIHGYTERDFTVFRYTFTKKESVLKEVNWIGYNKLDRFFKVM